MKEAFLTAKIDSSLNETRLDIAISILFPEISRRKGRKLISKGSVYLNNKRILILSKKVKEGDEIKIYIEEEPIKNQYQTPKILFDQNNLIAIDKPPFLPSSPTKTSIISAQYFVSKIKNLKISEIHPVNRLDTPVSGVLLFALNDLTARKIEELKRENKIYKEYIALTKGKPKGSSGTIELNLITKNGYTYINRKGKRAITRYELLEERGDFSLIKIIPVTGRTHQLRVHLKHIGCEILGDRKYGSKPYITDRIMLHSHKISFEFESSLFEISAPIPEIFFKNFDKIEYEQNNE